ncbi:unnamed protein product [Symbiodinium sp. CCMP2456]|nr:unnamed protein product [Symbiodinium sp. CCMP2456]
MATIDRFLLELHGSVAETLPTEPFGEALQWGFCLVHGPVNANCSLQPRFLRKPSRRRKDPSNLKLECNLGSRPQAESDAESLDTGDDINDVAVVLPPEQMQEDESLVQEMEMDRLLWTKYSLFLARYNEKWSSRLKFRDASEFPECDDCYRLKDLVKKMTYVAEYKRHIESVQQDRNLEQLLQAECLGTSPRAILFVQTDGMDQAKWSIPRLGDKQPKKTSSVVRKLQQILQDLNIRTWVGQDAVISAEILNTVRDWKGWFAKLRVDLAGGLLDTSDGLHSFIFMRRRGNTQLEMWPEVFVTCFGPNFATRDDHDFRNGHLDVGAAVRAVLRKPVTKDLSTKPQKKLKEVSLCTSPSSVTDQFNWASRFIDAAMKAWGRDVVLRRLQDMVKEHAKIVLKRWRKPQSASLDLRSAVDFDKRDLVIFENTPTYDVQLLRNELGHGLSDFFYDPTNAPRMTATDMKTAHSYKRCFKDSKQVYDLSQRRPEFFRTELKAKLAKSPQVPLTDMPYTSMSTYDLDMDEHPCQLIQKYVGGDQETFENFGAMKLNEFRFPTTDGKVDMPLFAVKYSKPTEGWPPKVNMDKFAESIFHGFEKDREPLEIQLTPGLQPGEPLYQGSVALTKGFCRCSIILYGIVQTIMKEASLREKKNLLQTALKFQERAVSLMDDNPGWSLEHALNESIAEYNNYGLAAQSAQYRLAEREGFALKALIFGVSAGSQQMMSRHLQANTWANSAFSVETIRNQRWLIGSTGRSSNPWWQAVETVSAAKQELFMERVLFTFSVRKKQCKNASTARLNGESWEQMLEASCLLFQLLEDMQAAKHASGEAVFRPEDLVKARRRGVEGDYNAELLNLITAKLAVLPTDTSLWKDHLPPLDSHGGSSKGASAIEALDLECVQKAFSADLLKLSEDQSLFSDYQQKLGAGQRQKALARVLRLKSENRRGSQLVVDWMERNCKHAASSYAEQHVNIIEFIKEYTPAATIVWADFTKCGTVQQDTLDEVTEEIRRICAAYPNKSCAVVIAPAMTSARVVAGKRGEMRRMEDKLDAKCLTSLRFAIRMDGTGHGNRRLPLLFPALFACSDAATKNVFGNSKMLVCTSQEITWLPVREYKVPRARNTTPCTTENMERSLSDVQMAAQYLGGVAMPREDWKSGNHPMGNVDAYAPDQLPDPDAGIPQVPTLHVCQVVSLEDGSKTLAISTEFRQKWSDDPARKDEWTQEMKAFDSRFGAHTIGEQPKPPPAPTSTSEDAEAAGEWADEPTSATELDRRYEILVTCPGRLASTQLRVCKAVETDQTAAKNVMPEQLYKLFIVDVALENNITIDTEQFVIAHDRATFMNANRVQKLLEGGGPHQLP